MANGQLGGVLRYIRQLVGTGKTGDRTDGQLLDAFARNQDRAALETLVQRYAPLVWGVCRRVLRDEHEAEDVFQGRVGPGITPRASRRSGRAQLRHPVRPVVDSPSALLSAEVALTGYRDTKILARCPLHGSTMSISLPSPGSPRSRFPCFMGTMEMCDFLRPSRRASLPSLGDTMRCCL
jgi:hypothetical protein